MLFDNAFNRWFSYSERLLTARQFQGPQALVFRLAPGRESQHLLPPLAAASAEEPE